MRHIRAHQTWNERKTGRSFVVEGGQRRSFAERDSVIVAPQVLVNVLVEHVDLAENGVISLREILYEIC